ncbi:MAG: hypothetical protein MPI93_01935 [Nitrosopumilus sp.]|nr:hypothetical protein [Nitrosopumilus sp.]
MPEPPARPKIGDAFRKLRLRHGGRQHVPMSGVPGGLEVAVDARPRRVSHGEAVAIAGWSPGHVPGQIAHKAGVVRDRAAYEALRALQETRRVPGIGPCTHPQEYALRASHFLRGLHDALHGSCRATHVLMPTAMHRVYDQAIGVLGRTAAWGEYVEQNASLYRFCNTLIIPSMRASRDSRNTAYAFDSEYALHFQGPASCGARKDVAGRYAAIETRERYQFLLLSERNARTASGAPYRTRPGFRLEVGMA